MVVAQGYTRTSSTVRHTLALTSSMKSKLMVYCVSHIPIVWGSHMRENAKSPAVDSKLRASKTKPQLYCSIIVKEIRRDEAGLKWAYNLAAQPSSFGAEPAIARSRIDRIRKIFRRICPVQRQSVYLHRHSKCKSSVWMDND